MKIALVHDWLTGMRGGEHALEVLCELFPDAPIHTLLWVRGAVSPTIESRKIITSPLQWVPGSARHYRRFLPFFPQLIRSFDLRPYDLVISTSHCAAKGVRVRPGAVHICYILAPMRYAWDRYFDYFADGGRKVPGPILNLLLNRLRTWDRSTSEGVDHFIAISENIARKVRLFYMREAEVICPPVDCRRFRIADGDGGRDGDGEGDYYLYVGAFVPYKKVELAIEACRRMGRRLLIVGGGWGADALRRKVRGDGSIRFAGWVAPEDLPLYYQRCRALLFPADEDFGIVPLEAMACGRPVVAYARGGALETVAAGETVGKIDGPIRVTGGILFPRQTAESLMDGIRLREAETFDPALLRKRAETFDRALFKERLRGCIRTAWEMSRTQGSGSIRSGKEPRSEMAGRKGLKAERCRGTLP